MAQIKSKVSNKSDNFDRLKDSVKQDKINYESFQSELSNNNNQSVDSGKITEGKAVNMTPYILMMGLGLHSLFEGIAVGMCCTMQKVSMMALAIVMHKGAAGMSLGTTMARAFPNNDKQSMVLIFMFSIFTPLGVLIGWAAQKDSPITEIVFNCLAAGTFIYIACSEVIIEEFTNPVNKRAKFLFYLVGIAFISSLKFVEPTESD